jgi:DNA polymerase I
VRIALFDTEGDGLLEDCTQLWCAVVEDYETGERTIFDPSNVRDLCAHLQTYDAIVAHNLVGHDLPVLRKLYGWEYSGQMIDTLLMSRYQRPARFSPQVPRSPHSIEAWGHRLGTAKPEHDDWSQFSDAMLHRCSMDVTLLRMVYEALLKEGEGEGWEECHKLNAKLFYYLQKQEEYGWLFDNSWASHCIRTLDRWIDRIDRAVAGHLPLVTEVEEGRNPPASRAELGEYKYVKKPFLKSGEYAAVSKTVLESIQQQNVDAKDISIGGPFSRVSFRPVDLDSGEETKQFLLSFGWEPEEWNVKDGKQTSPKLSYTDPFDGIQGSLGGLIAKRVQCRHRRSQIEGWIAHLREDGRIAARVGGIANTGRLKHAVIVNVPSPTTKSFFAKWMRKCFTSKEGWVLVGTDSKSNQVRQLAARLDDPSFTEFVLSGQDIHERNRQLSGVPTRTIAKNLYYGTVFGAGDKKIGTYVSGGTKQGKELREKFFEALPTLPDLLERERANWKKTAQQYYNPRFRKMEYRNGYIAGLDGRPILVEFEKDILVYYLQSDEAIQMAAAYCILHKWLARAGYHWAQDYGFVIWMHDEWQIECREEIAKHVAELSNEAIAWAGRYFGIKCPHEGESKIGKNWTETH